jgi:sugar-specific transcriptional regulator TrmB
MALETLRKAGLSDGEIKVYSALLDLGSGSVNRIHEKVGIERRNTYDILNKLIEKGFVSYSVENRKRTFQVSSPKRIIGYLEERKSGIERIKAEVEKDIPVLMAKFNESRPDINAEIFRGAEGIKAIWEDMLNYKETYWIGSGRYMPRKFPNFFANWNKRRVKKKHMWWNIHRVEMKKEIREYHYEKLRFLPKEFSGSPTVIGIYGDKVVNFIYGKELFAFLIESKELADSYRRYHKYLWKNVAKP